MLLNVLKWFYIDKLFYKSTPFFWYIIKKFQIKEKYCIFAVVKLKVLIVATSKKSKKKRTKKRSKGNIIWRIIWITAVSLVGLSVFQILLYKFVNPPLTPLMVQRFFQQVTQKDRPVHFERDYVSIEDISPKLVNAVVASEDGNFMHHRGFDVRQLKQSYRENKRGRRVRGGSTISMQTAKNAFLPHRRSMVRKALEAYYTQMIEWTWGKKRIMECYLNIIEFGDGIYGCEAASQHYFGHSAKTLSSKEAAQLAVTLPSPLKRNPAHVTPHFRSQTSAIVARSARYGHVNLDRKADKKRKNEETIFDFVKWYWRQEHGSEKHSDSSYPNYSSSHKKTKHNKDIQVQEKDIEEEDEDMDLIDLDALPAEEEPNEAVE